MKKKTALWLTILFSCLSSNGLLANDAEMTAGEIIAIRCFKKGYLGCNQQCPRSCCIPCNSQTIAPNVRTVARFTIQQALEPVMWYNGVPYHYGHTDCYKYCKYCHDVSYYYSCNCCVLILERISDFQTCSNENCR